MSDKISTNEYEKPRGLALLMKSIGIDKTMATALLLRLKREDKIDQAFEWIMKEGEGKETLDKNYVISNFLGISNIGV